jgi:hypothetical protein
VQSCTVDAVLPVHSVYRSFAVCLAALAFAGAAEAVVISSGNGTGNTTAPADDFGFENVGVTDTGLSGVYLGSGWVLTANHVGARPITLRGVTYQAVAESGVRLTNASGTPPDLYVYRINGFPNLPPVALATASPAVGESITCSGDGWTRTATLTTWNQFWQQGVPPPVYHGYYAGGGSTPRWGTNLVTTAGNDVTIGNPPDSVTRAFQTLFDENGGTTHEMQAVVGDSGGGCFAKRASTWELVGVMYAILMLPNQPVGPAVYGDSTVAADVAFYRTQIQALTPAPGPVVPGVPAIGAAGLAALLALSARRMRSARI